MSLKNTSVRLASSVCLINFLVIVRCKYVIMYAIIEYGGDKP